MKIPVVFAFDESYALAASVDVKSLIESKLPTTEYEIFVLHNGVSRRTTWDFAQSGNRPAHESKNSNCGGRTLSAVQYFHSLERLTISG